MITSFKCSSIGFYDKRFILEMDEDPDKTKRYERFFYQEAFRNLYTSIRFLSSDKPLRTIALTSSIPAEGKSLVNVLLAKTLSDLGYYVVRMGVHVREKMKISDPKIIDYAGNGLRTDFMDIYLGANCYFCISNGTGFDNIPYIFRRPIMYIDHVPLEVLATFHCNTLATSKRFKLKKENRFMTFEEIY